MSAYSFLLTWRTCLPHPRPTLTHPPTLTPKAQGTRLNGKPLPPNKPTVLKNGSELQFGQDPRRYILADIESAGGDWRLPGGLTCISVWGETPCQGASIGHHPGMHPWPCSTHPLSTLSLLHPLPLSPSPRPCSPLPQLRSALPAASGPRTPSAAAQQVVAVVVPTAAVCLTRCGRATCW